MKKALIFLPELGVYPYARTMALFGDALKKNDYDVTFFDCSSLLFRCPISSNKQNKSQNCVLCKKRCNDIVSKYNFMPENFKDFYSCDDFKEINDIVNNNDLFHVVYDNCKVGQIALHDLMVETKVLSSDNLNDENKNIYRDYIKSMILIIKVLNRYFEKSAIDVVMTFNPYAQCQAVMHACRMHGIKYFDISNQTYLGQGFSLFQISNEFIIRDRLIHLQKFCDFSTYPISYSRVMNNYHDSLYRMFSSGSHIFSASKKDTPIEIAKKIGLNIEKKIIGIFTSSYDEILGIENYLDAWSLKLGYSALFDTQISWLKHIIEFAKKYDDLQFVIRIHPREGRLKDSEHLLLLKKELQNYPSNVFVIWPNDALSSYDLFELLDLCLISLSTIGLECDRLGIPTMSYIKNFNYPNKGYIKIPNSIEEYDECIIELIEAKNDFNKFVLSSRYYNWLTFMPCINMESQIQRTFNDEKYWPSCPLEWSSVITSIVEGKINISDYNSDLEKKENNTTDIENKANYEGIKDVIIAFMISDVINSDIYVFLRKLLYLFYRVRRKIFHISVPENKEIFDKVNKYRLVLLKERNNLFKVITLFSRRKCYLVKDNNYLYMYYHGKCLSRYSPMLVNMFNIYSDFIRG